MEGNLIFEILARWRVLLATTIIAIWKTSPFFDCIPLYSSLERIPIGLEAKAMKPVQKSHIVYLTLGWFGIQMAMALDATQFQVMLDNKVSHALFIASVLSLGPLAGITIQPLMGWYGDLKQKEGFSRSTWIQYGLWFSLLSTFILAFDMPLWVMVLTMGVFYFSFNVLMVNYRAVVTETSTRRALLDHKGLISGFVALFSGAGSFTMFLLCSVFAKTNYPFLLGGLVLFVTFLLFFRYAPKSKKQLPVETDLSKSQAPLFGKRNLLFYALPVLAFYPPFERRVCQDDQQVAIFRLFTVLFFSWIGIQALRGYFVLYVTKALHLDLSLANLMLALLTLMMLLSALPFGRLADKLDNRLLYRYSLLFFACVCLLSFVGVRTMETALVMSLFLGISFAGMIVFPLSLLFKLCPPQKEGVYAGLYNLFLSIPQLYSLVLTGWLIETYQSYQVILLVAGVTVILAFFSSFRMCPLESTLSKPS